MAAVEIPKLCKGGVVVDEGPNFRVEVQNVPVPEPGPDEVLLKLNATGLCMSDVHYMMSDWDLGPMSQHGILCAGHEGVGEVVKLGANVKNWKIGDRGGVKPLWDICFDCELCRTGRENYCQNATYTGFSVSGTYQQYITSPARYTTRIPDGVPDHVAAPIMCAAATMHRALVESGLKPGQWAVFPGGGGGVGIQGVQLAKAMGFRCIVVDGGAKKKELALSMGAEAFIDFTTSKDVPADVIEAAGGIGAHCVFVTAWQAYKESVKYVGKRISAKIMCVALPPFAAVHLGADPIIYCSRNFTITGTMTGTMHDAAAALEYADRGLLQQISEVRGWSEMPEAVQQLKRGEVAGRIVIDFNKD